MGLIKKRIFPAAFFQKAFFVILSLLVATGASVSTAYAQTAAQPADSACDPEYMDALEARGWLEAQREISMNKNIIAKPDSVLEYTCFEQFLDVLGEQADVRFSGKAVIGSVTVERPDEMANYLQGLVAGALESYINSNFKHEYIDNRDGLDYDYGDLASVSNGSYSCSEMQKIWNASRCLNFMNDSATDGFFSLDWYTTDTGDPRRRTIETINQCAGNASYVSTDADGAFDISYNSEVTPYIIDNPNDTTEYEEDPIQTFLALILPPTGTAPAPSACGSPIPTGIVVERAGFTPPTYNDHVCSNPGCYFRVGGGSPSGCGPTSPTSAGGRCCQ